MKPMVYFTTGTRAPAQLGWASVALCGLLASAGPCVAQAVGHAPDPAQHGDDADLDAQLRAAREQLEQAARQVAELSARIGTQNQPFFSTGQRRGVIGLQLDATSGREGARILEVSPGGPAAEAGLRPGDVIIKVDDREVHDAHSAQFVAEQMHRITPGHRIRLRVLRDGKPRDFEVTAGSSPSFGFGFGFGGPGGSGPVVRMPAMPELGSLGDFGYFQELEAQVAGMELTTVTPALGRYFGTDHGVLVVRAPAGEGFRLEDGDVILAIDGREARSGAHATRILRSYQPGERVTLKILRQKAPLTLTATLPERPRSGWPGAAYPQQGPGAPRTPAAPATPAAPPVPPVPPAPEAPSTL
jgi:PDZ domain